MSGGNVIDSFVFRCSLRPRPTPSHDAMCKRLFPINLFIGSSSMRRLRTQQVIDITSWRGRRLVDN